MDCRSVFERWHLGSANQRVALWTVCWYVLSSRDHCHNPPSHIHNAMSLHHPQYATQIQKYRIIPLQMEMFSLTFGESPYTWIRAYSISNHPHVVIWRKSLKCLCEKIRWSALVFTHTRNSTYAFPNIFQIGDVPMIPHDTNSCKSSSPLQPKSTTSTPLED